MTADFFVGIGAAKSGTSWVAEYLREHPDVAMSPIKELHYFDARFCRQLCGHWDRDWQTIRSELTARAEAQPEPDLLEKLRCVTLRLEMISDETRYRHYFESILGAHHRAFGEITPSYSLLPAEGFLAIQKLYPKAKFIFLMRDPLERYLSHIRFIQKIRSVQGKEPDENFDANREALAKLSNPGFAKRADYQGTIETLLSTASENQLCILFYEHLFHKTQSHLELRRLCDFLSIEFKPAPIDTKVNASDKMQFDEGVRRKIRSHFSPVYDYVYQKYRDRVPSSWL